MDGKKQYLSSKTLYKLNNCRSIHDNFNFKNEDLNEIYELSSQHQMNRFKNEEGISFKEMNKNFLEEYDNLIIAIMTKKKI